MEIQIKDLWKQKKIIDANGEAKTLTILSAVTVEFCGSCIQMILGPSGSGKTTLLRLLNKLESPTKGAIYYNGVNLASIPSRQLRKEIGMVFQTPALFRGTIYDNISFGPALYKKEITPEQIARLLKLVGLQAIDPSRDVDSLSLGQQQRVSFARALANEPRVLLLDEPTSALDPSAANNLLELIHQINQEVGISIIMVTHVMEHAQRIADNVCLLVEGRIVETGSATEFFNHPKSEVAKKFIHGEL